MSEIKTGGGFASNFAFALAVAIGLVLAPIYLMGIYSQNAFLHVITVTVIALGMHSNNRSSHIAALISNGINLTIFVLIALVTFMRTNETIPTQQVSSSFHYSELRISSTQPLTSLINYPLLHEISELSEPLLLHFNDMKEVLFAFQVAVIIIFSTFQFTIWLAYRSSKVSAQAVSVWIGLLKFCLFDCAFLFGSIYAIILLGSFVISLFKVRQSAEEIMKNVGIDMVMIIIGLLVTAADLFPTAGKFKQMPVFYLIPLLINGLRLFIAVSTLIIVSLLVFDESKDKILLYHAESIILVVVFFVVFYGLFQYILWKAYNECKSAKLTAKCVNEPKNNNAQNLTVIRPEQKKWARPAIQPTNNNGMSSQLQTQPSAPTMTEIRPEPINPNPVPPPSVSSTTKMNVAQRPISGWNAHSS